MKLIGLLLDAHRASVGSTLGFCWELSGLLLEAHWDPVGSSQRLSELLLEGYRGFSCSCWKLSKLLLDTVQASAGSFPSFCWKILKLLVEALRVTSSGQKLSRIPVKSFHNTLAEAFTASTQVATTSSQKIP